VRQTSRFVQMRGVKVSVHARRFFLPQIAIMLLVPSSGGA
jgi:hypothetical protein